MHRLQRRGLLPQHARLAGSCCVCLAVWLLAQVAGGQVEQWCPARAGLAAGLPQGVPTWWQSSSIVFRDTGWGVPR